MLCNLCPHPNRLVVLAKTKGLRFHQIVYEYQRIFLNLRINENLTNVDNLRTFLE